jgi:hypothetical protein
MDMVQVSATRKTPSLVQGTRHSRCGAGFGTRLSPTVAEKVGVVWWDARWTKTRFCEWISNEAFLPCGLTKFVGHAFVAGCPSTDKYCCQISNVLVHRPTVPTEGGTLQCPKQQPARVFCLPQGVVSGGYRPRRMVTSTGHCTMLSS